MATLTVRGRYHILNWTDPETGKRKHTTLGKFGTIPKRELDDTLRIKEYGLAALSARAKSHRRSLNGREILCRCPPSTTP